MLLHNLWCYTLLYPRLICPLSIPAVSPTSLCTQTPYLRNVCPISCDIAVSHPLVSTFFHTNQVLHSHFKLFHSSSFAYQSPFSVSYPTDGEGGREGDRKRETGREGGGEGGGREGEGRIITSKLCVCVWPV